MKAFLRLFAPLVLGVLWEFDRLRFRGSQRRLCYPEGVLSYFSRHSILLKDYRDFRAEETTRALCQAIETPAQKAGIFQYLNNCEDSKEETALAMAEKHGQTKGLIAVLSCVEPSMNLVVRKNKESKLLEPRLERGKCLHYYHYYLDADFGLRYSRLQSWFPFTMHVGLNGRDWLGQQMLKAGIKHSKRRQLLHVDRGFRGGPEALRRAIENGMGAAAGGLDAGEFSPARDAPAGSDSVLLVGAVSRVRHGHHVSLGGGFGASVSDLGASCLCDIAWPRPAAIHELPSASGWSAVGVWGGKDDDQGTAGRYLRPPSDPGQFAEDVRQVGQSVAWRTCCSTWNTSKYFAPRKVTMTAR